jgi:hypothetical protein
LWFLALFTAALCYRARAGAGQGEAVLETVEQAVISAFLSVALKLSLEDFKLVYQRLVTLHQEAGSPGHLVTIFNLTTRVAEKLKSLFSFGVESTALLAVSALAEERYVPRDDTHKEEPAREVPAMVEVEEVVKQDEECEKLVEEPDVEVAKVEPEVVKVEPEVVEVEAEAAGGVPPPQGAVQCSAVQCTSSRTWREP